MSLHFGHLAGEGIHAQVRRYLPRPGRNAGFCPFAIQTVPWASSSRVESFPWSSYDPTLTSQLVYLNLPQLPSTAAQRHCLTMSFRTFTTVFRAVPTPKRLTCHHREARSTNILDCPNRALHPTPVRWGSGLRATLPSRNQSLPLPLHTEHRFQWNPPPHQLKKLPSLVARRQLLGTCRYPCVRRN